VRFAGELPSLLPLLGAASLILFPVEDLFAKVDTPLALLEAMDLEVPLLVASGGPAAELRGALKLELNDTQAWLSALSEVLSDASRRRAQVAVQKEHIENEFRAKGVAARYEALYLSLLAAQR
jgi:glycosyltransferase involved in cell wall biosynthesis